MNCVLGTPATRPPNASRLTGVILLFVVEVSSAGGQSDVPTVDDVDVRALRVQCRQVLDALSKMKAAMAPEIERELRALLKDEKQPSDELAAKIQKLLNDQCLVGVSINPESRVKAARGPRSAELFVDKESVVLVRVLNEAGVTHALSLEGPQIIGPKENAKDRWLHATVYPEHPSSQKLTGQKVEYVLLRLKAEKAGKREATLIFDVGQGTQDLGFRAEVPILFTIKEE
ncbi:MAG TPA: hypothetical protein VGX70_13265 [Gemmataceae bacterium]|nr:hypothetical protein [Gemmataceae bacterium]